MFYTLIREKKYNEFCDLYLEKGHLCREMPLEYGDLDAGNYVFALLGLKDYPQIIRVCDEEIRKEREESNKYDMSKSFFWLGLSIAYFRQKEYEKASDAIKSAIKTAYQDISRTEVPCIMYYESVVTGNAQMKRESIKILKSRLRVKHSDNAEFGNAKLLLGKINSTGLLDAMSEYKQESLRYKKTVSALFYIAVKCYEDGDIDGCKLHLYKAQQLYRENTAVTMMFEYYLSEMWLEDLGV